LLARAKLAYPFDCRFRRGVVEYYARTRWQGSRPDAEAALREELNADFYSIDLHRALASLYYEDGNMTGVKEELLIMRAFRPHRPLSLLVNANPANGGVAP